MQLQSLTASRLRRTSALVSAADGSLLNPGTADIIATMVGWAMTPATTSPPGSSSPSCPARKSATAW